MTGEIVAPKAELELQRADEYVRRFREEGLVSYLYLAIYHLRKAKQAQDE
jgi:hypothetical protein